MFKKIVKIILILFVLFLLFGGIYFLLKAFGVWNQINSASKIQQLILGLGVWGRIVFVVFQFLQVTFIPIPSPILIIAGSLIYGPFEGGLLSIAGILLGSAFAFFLGKIFGEKLVVFIVGKELFKKWQTFLNRCKYTFVLMMILPFFPDDVLCLVAGVTNMSWLFFMLTQFITRPVGVFLVSYFSSGQIIPYHGWGLVIWGIIISVSAVLIYLSNRYSNQIENFIQKLFNSKKT